MMNNKEARMSAITRVLATHYRGLRKNGLPVVFRCIGEKEEALDYRNDLWLHSPDGPEWGYGGSGPAQLALGLLCDALRDEDAALTLYQSFKWEVIARLDKPFWELSRQEILTWAQNHDEELQDQAHKAAVETRRAWDIGQALAADVQSPSFAEETPFVDVYDEEGNLRGKGILAVWAWDLIETRPGWTLRGHEAHDT
jgi:hypothetical protein